MEILPDKNQWKTPKTVVDTLEKEKEEFSDRQKMLMEEEEISMEEYGELLPQNLKIADEITAALNTIKQEKNLDEINMIDLGSGIGTYAAMGSSMGMDAVGIERHNGLYQRAKNVKQQLSDQDLLNGSLEYVEGNFYDEETWNEIDRDLEDFQVVVAYLPAGKHMENALSYLRENGPQQATYVFPELAGSREIEGFEKSDLNKYLMEDLGNPYFEKTS